MTKSVHISIMVKEILSSLRAGEGGSFLDCTFGGGGHTSAILEANEKNSVTAIDRDQRAVARAQNTLSRFGRRLQLTHSPFTGLRERAFENKFDGMLADLGMSTDQIREQRGFSFADESPLDMRMDESQGITAAEVVNSFSEHDLFVAFRKGGVGPEARFIAKAIVRNRPINTTKELATVISGAVRKGSNKNPLPVAFQAIRMVVNSELEEIENLMEVSPSLVRSGGRLCVLTFHSLEDKAVTSVMRAWEGADSYPAWWPGMRENKRIGRVVTRKPIVPSDEEIAVNPSARSARLRVFEFGEQ